jgi:2-hydroxychromene-2-carboxylate isomerase
MNKPPIAFYFDLLSPFAYIAATQIDALAARHGRTVDWRPVLVGVTVMKVMGMKPLGEYPLKGPYLVRDMERLAKIWGVPLRRHGLKGHNSLSAMRAYVWLKQSDAELAKAFARAIYRRLWVDGLDITPVDACVEEAGKLGVEGAALAQAVASDEVKRALQADVESAIAAGVFGAPFFIADDEPFFGNDHLWMLEQWLRDGAWKGPALEG